MEENKKLAAVVTLCVLGMCFFQWRGTASAAELVVNGGPDNMTDEQKAEWVDEIDGGGYTAEGDANNNTVYISSEVEITSNLIAGGYTENGKANGNKVSFDGVILPENHLDVYGGYSKLGDVSGNVIEVDNSKKQKGDYWNTIFMTAGETVEGNAVGNKILITNTVVENNKIDGSDNGFWGGFSEKGNVISNSVIVSKSNLSGYLVGGTVSNGNAFNNSVIISNSEIDTGLIRGADVVTGNGKVENNIVFIDNSKLISTEVIGGNGKFSNDNSHVGEIVSNIVKISNSAICGEIYGGKGRDSSFISDNVVQIIDSHNAMEDGSGSVNIFGGYSSSDTIVQENIVQIVNSNITLDKDYTDVDDNIFYGGRGHGTVKENVLYIENSTVEGQLVGGRSDGGNAEQNVVTINRSAVKGHIWGGLANNGIAKNNVVNISNSDVELIVSKKNIISLAGGISNKEAVGNTVIINNHSNIKSSGGKHPDIAGGLVNGVGKADDNYVAVVGSTVVGDIYGGLSMVIPDSDDDDEVTAAATEGSANNNTIYIENSTIAGKVVAGGNTTGVAKDNKIIISGNTIVENAHLIGAHDTKKGTGNTLILDGWSGKATSVAGFENYSFQNIKDVKNAVLTVGSASNIDANTKFDVSFAGSVDLQKGDTVKLIAIEKNGVSLDEKKQEASVGTSLDITGFLSESESGKGVDFKVGKITLNRQTDLIGSANAAAAAFLADGGELVVDGLMQINNSEYGFNTFAATHGANSDYDNGVDVQGWNNIVGVGHNAKTEAGDFAWGIFYEGGTSEYDTANAYHGNVFNADGKAVYNGYGAAARLNKDNGVYYEAGLRAGKLKNDLSNALLDVNGMSYGYKTESDYFGYHVGVGRAVALADGDQLDVYARYHHTKVDGDSFTVAAGDVYNLDKVYSDKIRLGGRYQDNLNEAVKVYYGAAWEYEFSGESEGSVKGYAMEKSDLGGSTFVGELGLLMNNPGSAWTVDMALQAYGGQREGIGGKVQATYHF